MFVYKYFNSILSGDPVLLTEKLLSIPDHICNEHVFSDNQVYMACPHPILDGDRHKCWLSKKDLVS